MHQRHPLTNAQALLTHPDVHCPREKKTRGVQQGQ
jgi:hypothetical protein